MTFDEWLSRGVAEGWISDPTCITHGGVPMTDDEVDAVERQGWDPCLPGVRLWGEDGPPEPGHLGAAMETR